MRDLVNWKDHVVEFPGRFAETSLGSGLVQLTASPGSIRQQGTPQNSTNFNTMDLAAFEAMLMANENARCIIQTKNTVDGLVGEKVRVSLNNTETYPANNSKTTVQLSLTKNNMGYTVQCEAVSRTDGAIGEFIVSDKLLNGFKVEYTGSAKSVVVDCYVRGGI